MKKHEKTFRAIWWVTLGIGIRRMMAVDWRYANRVGLYNIALHMGVDR